MDRAAARLRHDDRGGAAAVTARPLRLLRPMVRTAAALALLASFAGAAPAQTVGPPAKHNNNTYGSPLDTLKSSRLWTDTPEPKDFVRESRPPAAALDYTPLTGSDPDRPKPRDPANVAALQAEMERAGARLAGIGGRPRAPARRVAQGSSGAVVKSGAKTGVKAKSGNGTGPLSRDAAATTE